MIRVLFLSCVFLLSACGGGGGDSSPPPPSATPRPGAVQLTSATIAVDEGAATAQLTIERVDGSDGAISVRVASSNGSAVAGEDYAAVDMRVNFAAGDAAAKTITVTLTDDAQLEPEESLTVTLSEPNGGARLGAMVVATITIRDNERPALQVAPRLKQLAFSWPRVEGATVYRLYVESIFGNAQLGDDFPQDVTHFDYDVSVHALPWQQTTYQVEACNDRACALSTPIDALSAMVQTIGYFKAANTEASDAFGATVALSGDGRTLAVGAPNEDDTGTVYIFTHDRAQWSLQTYVKAVTVYENSGFGRSLALSQDGHVLVVGAPNEDSDEEISGAVHIFTRSNGQWNAGQRIKSSTVQQEALFGTSVAISSEGATIAVGAPGEAINGLQRAGGAYEFVLQNDRWVERMHLWAQTPRAWESYGQSVSLDEEGRTYAIGAPSLGDESYSGSVYVYTPQNGFWVEQGHFSGLNSEPADGFGLSVSLARTGGVLVVGAPFEDGATREIMQPGPSAAEDDESARHAGAAYAFSLDLNGVWSQHAYLKAANAAADGWFGFSVDLNYEGSVLAVGALRERSRATGVGGDSGDNSAPNAGAAYVFAILGGADLLPGDRWVQFNYVKASNTEADDAFGYSVALTDDAGIMAVGAPFEDSSSILIGGDQQNDSAMDAGAVYFY